MRVIQIKLFHYIFIIYKRYGKRYVTLIHLLTIPFTYWKDPLQIHQSNPIRGQGTARGASGGRGGRGRGGGGPGPPSMGGKKGGASLWDDGEDFEVGGKKYETGKKKGKMWQERKMRRGRKMGQGTKMSQERKVRKAIQIRWENY